MKIWPGAWLNCVVCIDLYDRDVVDHRRQMRQQAGKLRAGIAVARELVRRCEQLGHAFDEGEPLAL